MQLRQAIMWGTFLLTAAIGVGTGQQAPQTVPQQSVSGSHQEYQLLYANLHAHTSYSDGIALSPSRAFYSVEHHVLAGPLDALAITDHAELLSPIAANGYPLQTFELGIFHVHPTGYHFHVSRNEWKETGDAVQAQNDLSASSLGSHLIALRGFEWSADDEATVHGHINVIGTESVWRDGAHSHTDQVFPVGHHNILPAFKAQSEKKTLQKLFDWVLERAKIGNMDPSKSEFVCQFNHPNLYAAGAFDTFDRTPATWTGFTSAADTSLLDRHVALFELISRSASDIGPRVKHNGVTNEALYVRALTKGWHVAPAFNEDNHVTFYGRKPEKTGIWVQSRTPVAVLAALLERRVFATEDSNFRLMVTANDQPMGSRLAMSELPVDASGRKIIRLKVMAEDPDSTDKERIIRIDLMGAKWDSDGNPISIRPFPLDPWVHTNEVTQTQDYLVTDTNLQTDFAGLPADRDYFFFIRVIQKHGTNTRLVYSSPIWLQRNR